MLIGEYEIDDIGKMRHVTCGQEYSSWGSIHSCWVPACSRSGHYIEVKIPSMVLIVSAILYDSWLAERGI